MSKRLISYTIKSRGACVFVRESFILYRIFKSFSGALKQLQISQAAEDIK